jgi:hypothetical protein
VIRPDLVAQAPEVFQTLVGSPDRLVTDPYGVLACGVVAVAGTIALWKNAKPDENEGLAHDPSNPGLVREAVIRVSNGEDANSLVKDRWYRMGAPILALIGAAGLTAGAISGASAEVTTLKPSSDTVVAIQTSYSFENTTDMPGKTSRFNFAKQAIENSGYLGNMAVTQFGDTGSISTAVAMQPFSPNIIASNVVEQPPNFSVDGNDVADAITNASNSLPDYKGNIIVLTDGTGADKVGNVSIASAVTTAEDKGANLKFVVIGTSGANYQIAHVGDYPATPEPSTLVGVNLKDITVTNSPNQVEASIKNAIGQPAKVKEQRFYYPVLLPGAVALAAGLFKGIRQRAKKLI